MRLVDFLVDPGRLEQASAPEADALTDDGALDEAALLDVRINAISGTLWALFDCRGALQISEGNTAVVVLDHVEHLECDFAWRAPRLWHSVSGWRSRAESSRLTITALLEPEATLRVRCAGGEFFVGDVDGADDAPPDFTAASDEQIRSGMQGWDSPFHPIRASFLRAAG